VRSTRNWPERRGGVPVSLILARTLTVSGILALSLISMLSTTSVLIATMLLHSKPRKVEEELAASVCHACARECSMYPPFGSTR
jgi:hypothetical protein